MMHYFLGLEVSQYLDEIFQNQGKYTVEILKIFGMLDCKSMTTPPTIVTSPSHIEDLRATTTHKHRYKS